MALSSRLPFITMTAALSAALSAFAETPVAAETMDKGDVAWMMISTILVLFMILPGVALFYGGLVRTRNMLSILMQSTVIAALVMVIWVLTATPSPSAVEPTRSGVGSASCFLPA